MKCLSVPEFGFYGLKTKRRVDCSRLNVMASNPRGWFIKKWFIALLWQWLWNYRRLWCTRFRK